MIDKVDFLAFQDPQSQGEKFCTLFLGLESESEEKMWKKTKGKKLAMSSNMKIEKKLIFFEFSNRGFSLTKIFFYKFVFVSTLQRLKSYKIYNFYILTPQGRKWKKMSLKA